MHTVLHRAASAAEEFRGTTAPTDPSGTCVVREGYDVDVYDTGGQGPATRGFWMQHVRLGIWMSVVVITMIAIYLVVTPDRPREGLAWTLVGIAGVSTAGVALLPWRRLVRSRAALAVMVAWSLLLVPMIVVLAKLDGGQHSPVALLLMLPLVFAAMAYPFRATVLVGGAMVVGQLAIDVTGGADGVEGVTLRSAVLVLVAMMGALTSRHHWHSVTRAEELASQLRRLALRDGLTGCLNHRGFHERLDAEVHRGQRTGVPVALLHVDLDHFKRVNDTYGHPAGDEVLVQVGKVLHDLARRSDAVGRVGGEEFSVLLPGADLDEAAAVAQRLRARVRELPLPVPVTLSVGVSALPGAARTQDELIRTADQALYAAKRTGRDRVVVATHTAAALATTPSTWS